MSRRHNHRQFEIEGKSMRYADIITDEGDPVVQMAQQRLSRSAVEKDKNKLKVKQAQERKIRKDIQKKQRLPIGETEPGDLEDLKNEIEADEIGLARQ